MTNLLDVEKDVALTALKEITPIESIGAFIDRVEGPDSTVTLHYTCLLAGYPSWRWTVSIAHVEGDAPTVLEADLIPTDGALIAPEWVPWSVRLAEFLEAQRIAAEQGLVLEEEVPEGLLELTEGSLDGVDFSDDLDSDDDESDEDDEDDSDDDESDDEESDEDDDEDDDDEDDLGDIIEDLRDVDIDGIEFDEEHISSDDED